MTGVAGAGSEWAALMFRMGQQLGMVVILGAGALGLARIVLERSPGGHKAQSWPDPPLPRTATVTLLFTDVVESTQLLTRVGDAVADEIRAAHFALLRQAVRATNGVEVKSLGDGLMVVFTSAVAAVDCAVAMQEAVDRENSRPDWPPIGLRIGISVGEATVEGDDYFGTPVVEAARLCACGDAGQILVSDLLRRLAGSRSRHRFVSRGSRQLKGLSGSHPLCEVAWPA